MPDREKVIATLEKACRDSVELPPFAGRIEITNEAIEEGILPLLREQETEYKPDGPDFTKHGPAVRWKCSNCQYYVLAEDEGTKPYMKFCPNCGRKVSGDAAD